MLLETKWLHVYENGEELAGDKINVKLSMEIGPRPVQ